MKNKHNHDECMYAYQTDWHCCLSTRTLYNVHCELHTRQNLLNQYNSNKKIAADVLHTQPYECKHYFQKLSWISNEVILCPECREYLSVCKNCMRQTDSTFIAFKAYSRLFKQWRRLNTDTTAIFRERFFFVPFPCKANYFNIFFGKTLPVTT